jgi:TonB family protein
MKLPEIFSIILSLCSINGFVQTDKVVMSTDTTLCVAHDTIPRIAVEKNASFQNGDIHKFIAYVMINIRIPEHALTDRFQGRSIIRFTVDWDGQVRDVVVYKSSGYKIIDQEAIRVIKGSPKWTSAKINNICVPQQFFIPVEIRNLGVIGTLAGC